MVEDAKTPVDVSRARTADHSLVHVNQSDTRECVQTLPVEAVGTTYFNEEAEYAQEVTGKVLGEEHPTEERDAHHHRPQSSSGLHPKYLVTLHVGFSFPLSHQTQLCCWYPPRPLTPRNDVPEPNHDDGELFPLRSRFRFRS